MNWPNSTRTSHAPRDLYAAAAGELAPWRGDDLTTDRNQNNIWARSAPGRAWQFDVIVGGGDDAAWRSRRDPAIEVRWSVAVRHDRDVPYLAPHLQLLMKSKDVRPKDDLDAEVVIPELGKEGRAWLAEHLDGEHEWQALGVGGWIDRSRTVDTDECGNSGYARCLRDRVCA